MPVLQLVGSSYKHKATNINAQNIVNMYPVLGDPQKGDLSATWGQNTEGLKLLATSSADGICRGAIKDRDAGIFVIGNSVEKLTYDNDTKTGTLSVLGTINTFKNPISMDLNSTQIMIVDGNNGYIIERSSGIIQEITDSDFPGATSVTYIDGYFFFNVPGTGQMMATAINDGTSVNALDIATAESRPDNIIALAAYNGELWAFGENSIEVWYNAANSTGFPFSKRLNVSFRQGLGAAHSIQRISERLIWLNQNGEVILASGYQRDTVSTEPIHEEIQGYDRIDDAISYAYTFEGHSFYVLTFPSANVTWVYDLDTNLWHQRSSVVEREEQRFRATFGVTLGRHHLAGDAFGGKIHLLDPDTYTEDGEEIIRTITTPHLSQEHSLLPIRALEIRYDNSVALASGQGSDPEMTLSLSRDGGRNFGTKRTRKLGKLGKYASRVKWTKLGTARQWTARFQYSEPTAFRIYDAIINVEIL